MTDTPTPGELQLQAELDELEPDETYDSDNSDKDALGLSVAAQRRGDTFTGWVHMSCYLLFEMSEPVDDYPAGIEDFAAIVGRTFARRLAALIQPENFPSVESRRLPPIQTGGN